MFSEELKTQYPSDIVKKIEEIEKCVPQYEEKFYQRFQFQGSRGRRILGNEAVLYLLLNLQRSRFSYTGFIDSMNIKNPITAALSARAHLESSAALGYLLFNLEKYYNHEIKLSELHSQLLKLATGYKSSMMRQADSKKVESINILTMIKKADDLLFSKNSQPLERLFSLYYEFISERCHPNYLGHEFGKSFVIKDAILFHKRPAPIKGKVLNIVLDTMIFSCQVYFIFYEECFSLLKKHEIMPRLYKS